MCGRIAKYEHAPFGVSMQRFVPLGLHPDLGGREGSGAAVGTYYPKDILNYHLSNVKWDRQMIMKRFSEKRGGKAPHLLRQMEMEKQCGGPAVQNLHTFLELLQFRRNSIRPNIGLGTVKRFFIPKNQQNSVPAPGTYGTPEKPGRIKPYGTTVPPFLWDGCQKRKLVQPKGCGIPPTRYTVRGESGSIDTLLTKVVSKRGPYDLFTGQRDYSSIKNHFSPPSMKLPDHLFVSPPVKTMAWKGKWRKGPRFLKGKIIQYPPPGAYDLKIPQLKPVNRKAIPFLLGAVHVRPQISTKVSPAVGRYNPKWGYRVRPIRSPFQSTTPQTELFKIITYTTF